MSGNLIIHRAGPTQLPRAPIHRSDCCSALFKYNLDLRNGILTPAEIHTQRAWLLSHLPQDQICETCRYTFTAQLNNPGVSG